MYRISSIVSEGVCQCFCRFVAETAMQLRSRERANLSADLNSAGSGVTAPKMLNDPGFRLGQVRGSGLISFGEPAHSLTNKKLHDGSANLRPCGGTLLGH